MYGKKNVVRGWGQCESCGKYGMNTSYNGRKWGHLYFIPLIPSGPHMRVIKECTKCSNGLQFPETDVPNILNNLRQTSDDAMAATYFGDWINKRLDLFEGVTNVDEYLPTGNVPQLFACYPNPIRNGTTFSFYLPEQSDFTLRVYETNGQLIKEVKTGSLQRGKYQFEYNLSELRSGTYIYSLFTNGHRFSKQLIKI